jgi:hypothetical protein
MGEQLRTMKTHSEFSSLRNSARIFKKSQVSMEFVFLVGVAFMVMLVFISTTRSEFSDLRNEEEKSLVKDVSMMVQHELVMASNVEDGYLRKFYVPLDLDGISYNIQIINNTVLTTTEGYEYVLNIPSVIGSIQKGNNTINKTNSTIYLN